jgi:hypothetical protein
VSRAIKTPALACALLAAISAPAFAENQRLAAAWEAATGEEGGYLTPAAQAQMTIIAYHAAVAKLCDGFEVDAGEIASASNAVVAEAVKGLEGEALITRHTDLLIDLGTSQGIFLAEGSLHPDKFCAEAAEARADGSYDDHWR